LLLKNNLQVKEYFVTPENMHKIFGDIDSLDIK